jgi:hypothetical protein
LFFARSAVEDEIPVRATQPPKQIRSSCCHSGQHDAQPEA